MTDARATGSDVRHLLAIGSILVAALIAIQLLADREVSAPFLILCGIILFWTLPLLAWSQRARLARLFETLGAMAESEPVRIAGRPLLALFAISFVVLFVETMLIRYIGSQTRIFAFYKNIPLIGAFLGLGVGCFQGKGGAREALRFLGGMVGLALFFALAAQALGALLGISAAFASSERVFGFYVLSARPDSTTIRIVANLHIGLYCVAVFLAVAWVFVQLGRILGAGFGGIPRLQAYTANILGSLAGVAAFAGLSSLHMPPWVWFLVGLLPLLLWTGGRARRAGLALVIVSAGIVAPNLHPTVWSAYQKLVGREEPTGYRIDISDAFYQIATDLRPETVARLGFNPFPHYDQEFAGLARRDDVLVVGAGSGNDVAAALRAGARHVDAVDIDAAIVELGRRHHPERPYDDPRVRVIVDDARHAFKVLPPASYDAVVFGLLDSHTALGTSSVRLDNYVFTQESFTAATRLLRPGGSIVFSVVTGADWLRDRFARVMERVCDTPVKVMANESYGMYTCVPMRVDADPAATGRALGAPVDDWPFPYLPDRSIPLSYAIVIAMLAAASLVFLRRNGIGAISATPGNAHMFFLGAAFLLMEVYAINRLALLFGTTWLVSAVAIAAMLVEIVAANLLVARVKADLRPFAYAALTVLLLAGWRIGPEIVLGVGPGAAMLYALFLLSPVFCAGIVFATSFARASEAGPSLGANILGAVLGGWAEYATMVTGIRFMALLALSFYAASLIALILARRQKAKAASFDAA